MPSLKDRFNLLLLTGFTFSCCLHAIANDSIPVWTQGDVATSVDELWRDYDPRKEPLEVKIVRSWQQENVQIHYVVYTIGVFKGQKSTMAAFYTTPIEPTQKLPAVLFIHGGGQRAYLRGSIEYARRGYCCLSPNWGGREMENARPGDLNTDWGAVDPTQSNPQGYSSVLPGPKKIDPFESPRNNHWYLLTIGCRRAITFLEQQEEVDANRIGVLGHSMGGRLTGLVAGSDKRVKVASPSVGGSGFLYQDFRMIPGSARRFSGNHELMLNTISGESHLKQITCPLLFLSSTNDFNAPMECVEQGMRLVPHSNKRTTYSVHLNHRFDRESDVTRKLWLDSHLQNKLSFPKSPILELHLNQPNGIPVVHVQPDTSREIKEIRIYYGYDRDPRNRFWATANARVAGNIWVAQCPVFDLSEPLFVLANVYYKLAEHERIPTDPDTFILSASDSTYPAQLKQAGVRATASRQRVIEHLGMSDAKMPNWYILNQGNPHHWLYSTRKLNDPRWEAPQGGTLKLSLQTSDVNNHLAIKVVTNSWRSYIGKRSQTYISTIELANAGEHQVTLHSSDFMDTDGNPLNDWEGITELQFQPADKALPDNNSLKPWQGSPLGIIHLEWLDGKLQSRPKPYPTMRSSQK